MQSTHNENAANRPPGADADSLLHSSSTAPATILIVEDETLVSFFIRTLLEDRGLQVAVAATHEYRHEALFYDGADDFMEGVVPFIDDAVQAEEPILVVLSAAKIDRLREALVAAAEPVLFADMAEVGANPARIFIGSDLRNRVAVRGSR